MKDFLENIKRELKETDSEHATITVSKQDVEKLVKSYEKKSELLIQHIANEQNNVLKKLHDLYKYNIVALLKDQKGKVTRQIETSVFVASPDDELIKSTAKQSIKDHLDKNKIDRNQLTIHVGDYKYVDYFEVSFVHKYIRL